MNNIDQYNTISLELCRKITESYSSSFSVATSLLSPKVSDAIVSVYAFVRIADEVVDTWRPDKMDGYLGDLTLDLKRAIKSGFSTNPIVHCFAGVVKDYQIPSDLIDAFIKSMRMDIKKRKFSEQEYRNYIYGSAEAVGLMCLMIFVNGSKRKYNDLLPEARALGSAFQKINFLRDYSSDSSDLGRVYFPHSQPFKLDEESKNHIINDINNDLQIAKPAIQKLPISSRYGVELAYSYFAALTKLMARTPAQQIAGHRISLPKSTKAYILTRVKTKQRFTK